jgi:Tfp pilus assembly PilM family ATPase
MNLPYSEQQEAEARRANIEVKMNALTIGWSYDPDDLRTEVDTILHSFSTRELGAAESVGAMAAVALRAIKMLRQTSESELHADVAAELDRGFPPVDGQG